MSTFYIMLQSMGICFCRCIGAFEILFLVCKENFPVSSPIGFLSFGCFLLYLQVLDREKIMGKFQELTAQLEQALTGISYENLDISDEVKEQVSV